MFDAYLKKKKDEIVRLWIRGEIEMIDAVQKIHDLGYSQSDAWKIIEQA